MGTKITVYQIVTNRIIEELEKGIIPWRKPWSGGGMPMNFVTKKLYRGVNCLLLRLTDFTEPYFLTFNQVQKLGGSVKPGSKSHIVVYWNWIDSKTHVNKKGEPEKVPLLRYYRVFNIQQVSGIEYQSLTENLNEFKKDENCEVVVNNYMNRPEVRHEEQRAYYRSSDDCINMPKKETFVTSEKYYATLFHELVHSTGHSTRLKREGVINVSSFGSADYSKEELIAETGAAFLCARTGIVNLTFKNSVAYIQGWLAVLKKDSKFLINATGKAQKAVDFITGEEFI